nr:T9SS type A sorting domain-containing protein [Bacteroidota bacterium]
MKKKTIFLFLLLPAMVFGQVQLRLPDTTVVAGTTVNIPVYVDSSLTGLNVFSYQLQVSFYNNRLNPIGLNKTGTLTEAWGEPLFNPQPGIFTLINAGVNALEGTGVLVYLVCETMDTDGTPLSFTGPDYNFFNEGEPGLTFVNAYISKTSPPSISISPDNAILAKGETQQFNVSGQGTPPYSWGVTNPGICSIDENGLLSTDNYGVTRVYCTDALGLTDTTEIIDIKAVKLTLPQSSGWPQQLISLPVSITNTDGLEIISGEIEYSFYQNLLTPLDLNLENTLLENAGEVLLNLSQTGRIKVNFATTIPLAGGGILFFINFQVANVNSGATYLNFEEAYFNESLDAKTENGYFSINYANISFNPYSADLVIGEEIDITVSGGTAPYIWEVINPEVASIWNFEGGPNATLTALSGGTTQIKVTDDFGIVKTSGDFMVFDTYMQILPTSIPVTSTALVPVMIDSIPEGKEIFSIEAEFECYGYYLEFWGVNTENSMTNDWELLFELNDNKMNVVAAGINPISNPGVLFYLLVYAKESLPVGTNANINIENCLFNEGVPTVKLGDGYVTGVPKLPNIEVDPLSFDLQLPVGGSHISEITVENSGFDTLFFSVTFDPDSLAGIITINEFDSIVEPGNASLVEILFTTTGLEPGIYNAEILITSNDPNQPEIEIPVTLEVVNTLDQSITLDQGWVGLSSYLSPLNPEMEFVFNQTAGSIIILQNEEGIYWPGQGINTIGFWSSHSGYSIKVSENCELTIYGDLETNRTLTLDAGWNLIPVISECEADVGVLFDGTGLIIAKEVAGKGVYWPYYGINTIGFLEPGNAYFVLMESMSEITYPECEEFKTGDVNRNQKVLKDFSDIVPWKLSASTASTHTIAIPSTALADLEIETGELIAAIDETGNCYGITEWRNKNTAITIFGDDPLTDEKDGFSENDFISLQLYNPETKQEAEVIPLWDQSLPEHDGLFRTNGLSAITELKVSSTGIHNPTGEEVQIFPNPAKDQLNIIIPEPDGRKIIIVNIHGQQVYINELVNRHTKVDVSLFEKGLYFVRVLSEKQNLVRKVVKE